MTAFSWMARASLAACLLIVWPAVREARGETRMLVIRSVEVRETKKDGKSKWDSGRGEPDLKVTVERQSDPKGEFYRTGVKQDVYQAVFNRSSLQVSEGDEIEIHVLDDDLSSDDEIGRMTRKITQEMLQAGSAEFSFDQVLKLTVTFDR